MKRRSIWHGCVMIASSTAVFALVVALPFSYWRVCGWATNSELWVRPAGAPMQELHVTTTALLVTQGRVEWSRFHWLRAVIPAGSSAAGPAQQQSAWVWDSQHKKVQSAFGEQWHARAWNDWRFGDLGIYAIGPQSGGSGREVSLPLWLMALVMGSPLWLRIGSRIRAHQRVAKGQCASCGYPRGSLGSHACTECGKPFVGIAQ